MSTAALRARLLAEAEATIDGLLAKAGSVEQMTLEEMVELALESGQQVEAAVVAALSQEQADGRGQTMVCEQCGSRMHYKGKRLRAVVTSAGETRLERDYYYCARCKVGRFPPG